MSIARITHTGAFFIFSLLKGITQGSILALASSDFKNLNLNGLQLNEVGLHFVSS